jgi:hypothetical protein
MTNSTKTFDVYFSRKYNNYVTHIDDKPYYGFKITDLANRLKKKSKATVVLDYNGMKIKA